MKSTTIFTGFLIKLIFENVQCELVAKPADAIIAVNDSVTMKCSYNDINDVCENIIWKHYKPNSRTGVVINTGNQLKTEFRSYISIINTTAGNCNLMINATPLAAGTYKCVDMSDGDESSAEMIIIDPGYRVKGNVAECSARYYGNEAHITQWMESHGDGWTRVDANGRSGYQQYISVTTPTPNLPIMCSLNVSVFGELDTYEWYLRIEETITTKRQIATNGEFTSVESKGNEPKPLSDDNTESVSENKGLSPGAIAGISVGAVIVPVATGIVIAVKKKKK